MNGVTIEKVGTLGHCNSATNIGSIALRHAMIIMSCSSTVVVYITAEHQCVISLFYYPLAFQINFSLTKVIITTTL